MTIQDFSAPKKENLKFKIDEDVFEAVAVVGAELLRDVTNMTDLAALQTTDVSTMDAEQVKSISEAANQHTAKTMMFLDAVLTPDSAARFGERLRSTTEPITIQQAYDVWRWLIEQYAARPTQPSLPSLNGHDGTGTSSTAGAPATT